MNTPLAVRIECAKGEILNAMETIQKRYASKDGKKVAIDLGVETVDGNQLMQRLNKYFPGKYYNGI